MSTTGQPPVRPPASTAQGRPTTKRKRRESRTVTTSGASRHCARSRHGSGSGKTRSDMWKPYLKVVAEPATRLPSTLLPFPFCVAWLLQHQLSRIPERDAFPMSRLRSVPRDRPSPSDTGVGKFGPCQTRAGALVRGAGVQAVSPAQRGRSGAKPSALTAASTRACWGSDENYQPPFLPQILRKTPLHD